MLLQQMFPTVLTNISIPATILRPRVRVRQNRDEQRKEGKEPDEKINAVVA